MGLTLSEIQRKGWEALVRELGFSGALKFMLLYEKGEGDYTKEKPEIFKDMTGREIFEEMKKMER